MKDTPEKSEFRIENSILKEAALYTFCITILGYATAYSYESGFLGVFSVPPSSIQVTISTFFQAATYIVVMTMVIYLMYVVACYFTNFFYERSVTIDRAGRRAGKKPADASDVPRGLMQLRDHTPTAVVIASSFLFPYYIISDRIEVLGYSTTQRDVKMFAIIVIVALVSFFVAKFFAELDGIVKIALAAAGVLVYFMIIAGAFGKFNALTQSVYWTTSVQDSRYVLIKDYGDRLLLAKLSAKGKMTDSLLYSGEHDITLTSHTGRTFYEQFMKE